MLAGIEGAIGGGPLLVPTYTYSYTRGEDFEPARSKSTVGAFGDWVRSQPHSRRTPDPIYSTVVRGDLSPDWERRLFDVGDSDCFGPTASSPTSATSTRTVVLRRRGDRQHVRAPPRAGARRPVSLLQGLPRLGHRRRPRDADDRALLRARPRVRRRRDVRPARRGDARGRRVVVGSAGARAGADAGARVGGRAARCAPSLPPTRTTCSCAGTAPRWTPAPRDELRARADARREMYALATELFPITRPRRARFRDTLEVLEGVTGPMQRHRFATGERVPDWTIPREWVIRDAWIRTPTAGGRVLGGLQPARRQPQRAGRPRADLATSCRSTCSACPSSLTRFPTARPTTSDCWGFCLSDASARPCAAASTRSDRLRARARRAAELGEIMIPGTDPRRCCSRPTSAIRRWPTTSCPGRCGGAPRRAAARRPPAADLPAAVRARDDRRDRYLSRFGDGLRERLAAGFVVTCVGDPGRVHLQALAPRRHTGRPGGPSTCWRSAGETTRDRLLPAGSDERQYCSPGFNLPVAAHALVVRRVPGVPHSLDDLELITPDALGEPGMLRRLIGRWRPRRPSRYRIPTASHSSAGAACTRPPAPRPTSSSRAPTRCSCSTSATGPTCWRRPNAGAARRGDAAGRRQARGARAAAPRRTGRRRTRVVSLRAPSRSGPASRRRCARCCAARSPRIHTGPARGRRPRTRRRGSASDRGARLRRRTRA